MSKRKFDYMEFQDHYGVLFDADRYTKEQALEIYKEEFNYLYDEELFDSEYNIVEDYVKWKPRMSKEDMWYFDIYDNVENHGIYMAGVDPNEKGAFKVWKIK